jgi:hypothetical protein
MIQKLRNYLLADSDSKGNFFYIAAFALVGPSFFYFFDKNKRNPHVCGTVNGIVVDKRLLQLKYQENMSRIESIMHYFKGSFKESDLYNMFFGGMSPEQFTVLNEIKHCYLAGILSSRLYFSKVIASALLSRYFSGEKFHFFNKYISGVVVEAIKGDQNAIKMMNHFGLPFDVLEDNAEKSILAGLSELTFSLNFGLIHSLIGAITKKNVLKAHFDTYTIDFNKFPDSGEKYSHNDLFMFYQSEVMKGRYKSPSVMNYTVCKISIDKNNKSFIEDFDRQWKVVSSVAKKFEDRVCRVEKHFNKNVNGKFTVVVSQSTEGQIFVDKDLVSKNIAMKMVQENRKGISFIVNDDDFFYMCLVNDVNESKVLPFDHVEQLVYADLKMSRARTDSINTIINFSLGLEEVLPSVSIKSSYVFEKIENSNSNDNKARSTDKDSYYDIIEKKFFNGMVNIGDIFYLEKNNTVVVFVLKNVVFDENEKHMNHFLKDFVSSYPVFIDQAIRGVVSQSGFELNLMNDKSPAGDEMLY